jgi:hypothetical protein
MEDFSTPQSKKRTASLPSPHPIVLQSCCSTPLGCLPLGLCQATAPHQIHAPQDSCLLGHARSMHHRDPCPSAMTDASLQLNQHPLGSPPLLPHCAPVLHQIHAPSGSSPLGCTGLHPRTRSPPLNPPALQALLGPSSTWDDWSHAPQGSPSQAQPDLHPARIPSPWAELDPALQAYQITAPPGSRLGRH